MRSVCMYVYMYVRTCIYMYVCMYVYMYCYVMLCYVMGRCDMCPVAFCEDCLPATHEIIGPLSERWAPLGFRPLRYVYMYVCIVCMYIYVCMCVCVCGGRSGCFIFCSPECKQFGIDMAEREKADSSQVRSTPLRLSLTNKLYVCRWW